MNASILFLTSALTLGADAPIIVSGSGCGNCSSPAVSYGSTSPLVSYAMPSSSVVNCDPCGPRIGLFAKLRAKLASLKPSAVCQSAPLPLVSSCAPAVVACASPITCGTPLMSRPVFTGFTTSCADPCERVSLLDRLRAKFSGCKSCDACAAPLAAATWTSSAMSFPTVTTGIVTSAPVVAAPILSTPATEVYPQSPVITPNVMPAPPAKDEPKKEDLKKEELKKDDLKKDEPKKEVSLPSILAPAVDIPRAPVLGGTSGKY